MKRFVSIVIATVFVFCSSYCLAAPPMPNLVGTWSVKAEGGMLLKADKPGEKSHRTPEQTVLTAEARVLEQKGRVIKGEFVSSRATEKFIAVIAPDNKSIYYADEDGTMDMKMIDKDTIQIVYRHVAPNESVVAVGTWKRKK
jgi:hypothetical protein